MQVLCVKCGFYVPSRCFMCRVDLTCVEFYVSRFTCRVLRVEFYVSSGRFMGVLCVEWGLCVEFYAGFMCLVWVLYEEFYV